MIHKHIRISTTILESFRLYKTEDWLTHEDFLQQIKGEEPTSPAMALGNAYDKIMSKPEQYMVDDLYVADGFTFDAASIDDSLDFTERRAFTQYKAVREFEVNGTFVELVGKADALYGLVAWDYKARTKALDANKAMDYMKSLQWKAYTEIFGLQKFIYLVAHLSESGGVWFVQEVEPITLYPYEGLYTELMNYLREFVQFIQNNHLEVYFQPKKLAV